MRCKLRLTKIETDVSLREAMDRLPSDFYNKENKLLRDEGGDAYIRKLEVSMQSVRNICITHLDQFSYFRMFARDC